MKNNTDKPVSVQPLVDVVKALRAPNGCPWDQKQTHESLRRYFIEETYEVVDAIDNKDMANLREELGDVLLQVVFHSQNLALQPFLATYKRPLKQVNF